MRESVHVGVVQFAPQLLEKKSNLNRMSQIVASTGQRNSFDLIVFPELATTGYVPATYSETFHDRLRDLADSTEDVDFLGPLREAAKSSGCFVAVGFSETDGSHLYNSLALIDPTGSVVSVHRKVHLWSKEGQYFTPGDRFDVVATELGTVALSLCYDSRLPENTRAQVLQGAEIAICSFALVDDEFLSAAESLGRRASTRAIENGIFWVACNRTGQDETGTFNGGSAIADPAGALIGTPLPSDPGIIHAVMTSGRIEAAMREADEMNRAAVVEVRPKASHSDEPR